HETHRSEPLDEFRRLNTLAIHSIRNRLDLFLSEGRRHFFDHRLLFSEFKIHLHSESRNQHSETRHLKLPTLLFVLILLVSVFWLPYSYCLSDPLHHHG